MSAVLDHVVASIGAASAAHGALARQRLGAAALGPMTELAVQLAAAQHAVSLRVAKRALVVVAADHGVGAPGVDFGDDHPTAAALRAIAAGDAAVASLARAAGATVMVVDAGCAGTGLPATAVQIGVAPTGDFMEGAAMRDADVAAALEAGIALAVALVDDGMDVVGVGGLGLGSEDAAAALVERIRRAPGADGVLALVAEVGGGDTAVLAGLMLGAASMTVPVILDDHQTLAAAVVAAQLAPAVTGCLIASQRGSVSGALELLRLEPLIAGGIGGGEGAGAAMVMSLVGGAAALLAG